MAIAPTSSASGLSSSALGQIQQQQAQRNADRAEQQARSLRAQADAAQTQANQAQESARSLRSQSAQAQADASSARLGLAALKSARDVQTSLANLRTDIGAVLERPASQSQTSSAGVVINTQGQATGTLISVTA